MNGFLVTGIGASAGGIQALRAFFEATPADSGIAYVVILHLSPDHDSQLAQVLQQATAMPVTQVQTAIRLEPDNVYVIPPDKHLVLEDGELRVFVNTNLAERRAPVDIFFRSLAESHGSRAVGVLLSGTGANGSMGLKRIKERGGAVFVQSPREAEFNEMPRNAIATDLVDEVLNVVEIPAKIIAYRNSLAGLPVPAAPQDRKDSDQEALRIILSELRMRTGHDFGNYKRPTLLRRIERRVHVHDLPGLTAYAGFIFDHPEELQGLLKDLLISVTNFYRDKQPFEELEAAILPRLLEGKSGGDQLRIWVAGCATGEEAYSIAMLCADLTFGTIDPPKIQIFATDIDETAIAIAREGFYTLNDAADIPQDRLDRYFIKDRDGFKVRRELRETVLFAIHNVLKDSPFSHIDLVSCRNLLIYLNRTAQERVFETFHFSLNPDGFLLLGTSESMDGASDLFSSYNRDQHIWQRRQHSARNIIVPTALPRMEMPQLPARVPELPRVPERISFAGLHQELVELYAPPSLIINSDYDIVHISEHAGRYLSHAGGEPTQNLLRTVHEDLRTPLRNALYQAVQQRQWVTAAGLQLQLGSKTEIINLHVRPTPENRISRARGYILVLFEPVADTDDETSVVPVKEEAASMYLEEEVARLKTELFTSNEQHGFAAEELKAGNEELQAMNEELRSATEELETSKEELQSINEELSTVNQELKVKVEELSMMSSNLQNLINSTSIGTIFLDRSLRIILFTPAARTIFNLIPADHGRALSDITSRLHYEGLITDAQTVLQDLNTVEREGMSFDGRAYLMRLSPYRTDDDHIGGVTLAFVDITERKQAEEQLRQSEEWKSFLLRLSDTLRAQSDPETIRAEACALLGEHLRADCAYHAPIGNGDRHQAAQELRAGSDAARKGGFHPEEYDWIVPLLQRDEIAVAKNTQTDDIVPAEDRAAMAGLGIASFIVAPLVKSAALVGAVCVTTSAPREWTEIEIGLVRETAERIWSASERARSEDALKQSEARTRVTLESAMDYAIINFTTEGIIEGWSRGAERIFQWTEAEVLGRHAGIIFVPEDREAGVLEQELEIAARDGMAPDERWHIRKDGDHFFMSGVMRPINEGGVLRGFVKVACDLTERQRTEAELRLSEERYRIALQSAEMAAWDWDIFNDLVVWNDQHYYLLGLEPDGKANRSARFLEYVHPDDKKEVSARLLAAVGGSQTFHAEFRIVRAGNGGIRWMSGFGRVVAVDAAGLAHRMVGVMYDITDRFEITQTLRDRQLKLEIAQRAARVGIWGYDLVKHQGIATPELIELTGYPHTGETWDIDIFMRLVHPDDRSRLLDAHGRAAAEQSGIELEFRLLHPKKDMIWVLMRGQYIPAYENTNPTLMGSLIDITERRNLEQQKEEFIGIASHELRTPVTSIKAYAEILHEMFIESGDLRSAGLMEKLDQQVDRLSALVYALLDTTRIVEGKLELQYAVFPVDKLIAEVAEQLQHVAGAQTLQLELKAGVELHADRERIGQVLTNLISNAIKYAPGTERITISSETTADGVRIAVQDFGIGIGQDELDRVFERFFRSSTTNSVSGLGLGLFISSSIVREHGGRIWAESDRENGTVFYFTLPLLQPADL